ncbi:dienelactone hydrolase family protein [Pseudohalioglobus lutimaris]|nr:dienelactone hydrolase family protein [Pseudohalioglobus lutimaris]
MKRVLITAALVILLIIGLLLLPPVRARLIALTLPDHPDWPAPQDQLQPGTEGPVYYATTSPYDLEIILGNMALSRPTTGKGFLSYPQQASTDNPVPAMVIVPGSGGITPGREHEYAAWFNQRGIAAFVVEYYEPRGFSRDANYVIRTSSVTEFDLIADAYAALKLLQTSASIDSRRIGIIGFSYGGMAARLAMDRRIHQALAPDAYPFNLHIDAYGPCYQDLQSDNVGDAPLLTLRGTEDASNDLVACRQREDALRALGTEVTAHLYEGAGHAWEASVPRFFSEDSPYLAGCELVYDDNGRPLLNGEYLNEYTADASHAEKMLSRFTSAPKFKDCVGFGYIVGFDEPVRDRAYADIEAFLEQYWGPLGVGP